LPQPGSRRPAAAPAPAGGGAGRGGGGGLGVRLRTAVADVLDLPRELVFDLPRITLVGALQCTVENHRGLLEFFPERVAIGLPDGRLVVTGRDLTVGAVRDGEIVVTGLVEEVRFERTGA
jgi:sporulation protein YqfC